MGARLACGGVVLGVALGLVGSASPSTSGPGRIVFAANRAPLYYGEIWRVGSDGTRVDLTRNAAADVGPALSPDGSLVAFASNRGGHAALYVVRIDGTQLRRVSPLFFSSDDAKGVGAQIAWSRDGKMVAAAVSGYGAEKTPLWVGDLSGHGRVVAHVPVIALAWSPDGKEIAYQPTGETGGSEIDVISPTGKPLWYARGDFNVSFGWNPHGLLAATYHGIASVYDEQGHKIDSFSGSVVAWSPDGRELASLAGRRLQVRRAGAGAPIVDVPMVSAAYVHAGNTMQWLGNGRIRVGTGDGFVGFDVADDRPLPLPPAYASYTYAPVVSADGNALAEIIPTTGSLTTGGLTATLHIATFAGATSPALASGPPCAEQPWFQSIQFTPDGRSLVYQGGCAEPNADIYSIGSDGRGLQQLTTTTAHEQQPAWSPDGQQIAYESQAAANKCDGCPNTIWLMNADGSNQHPLTQESQQHFDDHPTFSPNGREVAFWRWTYSSSAIETAPIAGGPPTVISRIGSEPVWGPTRIAFVNGSVAPTAIDTVNPDGSSLKVVARDNNVDLSSLAWSPSGRLAYLSTDTNGHLYLVVVGAHQRLRLGGLDSVPLGSGLAWSPDGSELAFTASDSEGLDDIWVINVNGTHLHRLTHGIGAIGPLSWR